MSRESESTARVLSTGSVEQPCAFGTIVRALWPNKPALNLAQRIGCSERAAQFYIDGERKVSAACVGAIVAAMLSSRARAHSRNSVRAHRPR